MIPDSPDSPHWQPALAPLHTSRVSYLTSHLTEALVPAISRGYASAPRIPPPLLVFVAYASSPPHIKTLVPAISRVPHSASHLWPSLSHPIKPVPLQTSCLDSIKNRLDKASNQASPFPLHSEAVPHPPYHALCPQVTLIPLPRPYPALFPARHPARPPSSFDSAVPPQPLLPPQSSVPPWRPPQRGWAAVGHRKGPAIPPSGQPAIRLFRYSATTRPARASASRYPAVPAPTAVQVPASGSIGQVPACLQVLVGQGSPAADTCPTIRSSSPVRLPSRPPVAEVRLAVPGGSLKTLKPGKTGRHGQSFCAAKTGQKSSEKPLNPLNPLNPLI